MRRLLIQIVERACQPFDAMVCEIANLTDEPDVDPPRASNDLRASA